MAICRPAVEAIERAGYALGTSAVVLGTGNTSTAATAITNNGTDVEAFEVQSSGSGTDSVVGVANGTPSTNNADPNGVIGASANGDGVVGLGVSSFLSGATLQVGSIISTSFGVSNLEGFAAGEIPKLPLNLTLLKGCDVAEGKRLLDRTHGHLRPALQLLGQRRTHAA